MVDWEEFYGSFRQPGFLPGYEIGGHLGSGAFGEVYKARKTSIDKTYAIKFLRLESGGSSPAIERELEQVRLFAAIDHPNLVTIEDMGVASGVPFVIMGYAGEDTLARRIEGGTLSPESALQTFVQVCRGVLALHERNLAHFDLKPANVFLHGAIARVGDYGLAKLLSDGRMTLSFGRGTPHYMAPEMLRSRADQRADVYSLGVILFESLAFRLPFGSRRDAAIVREEDTSPDFPVDFPGSLRGVVERCLRLDPEDRYDSVGDLLEAMGQTAERDSAVRLDDVRGERPRSRPPLRSEALRVSGSADRPEAEGTPAKEGETSPEGASELRQAAAELARGAVGVAKGVWSGVTGDAATPAQASADDLSQGAAALDGDDPFDQALDRAKSGSNESALGAEVLAVSGLGDDVAQRSHKQSERLSRVTIPVPPRAEGGWVGGLRASLALGFEILGALVTGPVLAGARGLARRVSGSGGSLARLGLWMVLAACLGGLVSLVVLALVVLEA